MTQPSADSLPVSIRRGTPADAAALAAFAARTFEETFGAYNDPGDLAAYLSASYGAPQQEAELRDPGAITLLAEAGGSLAGYAQLRHIATPPGVAGRHPVEIRRFYIDTPFHGRGAARQLMAETIAAARAMGGDVVWLQVWERNPRGIAFYEKCGFTDVGSTTFVVGSDVQTDRVMTLPLADGQD
ncbi:GNAT family N-acetyltransferase [Longimicrobium sp.]|uniref:GNAT family N-acetyltransferase n=1 Tax=Longimicrobium sp. TaxID=2029185 RepID=UPI002F9371EF